MEKTADELRKALLAQGYDRIREVIIELGPDWSGAESYFVWVLLDDATRDDELDFDELEALTSLARKWMRDKDNERYPYIRVRRVHEWYEMVAV